MIFGNIGCFPPYLSPYNLFNNPSLEFPSQGTVTEQVTLLWFYLKKIDEILDKLNINIEDVYSKEETDDKLTILNSKIDNNKVASDQSDKVISDRLNSNVDFLQNQINILKDNQIKEVKLNKQTLLYLNTNLVTANNSFKIGNYYVINIDVHNNSGSEISVNSNNVLTIFDDEDLQNLTQDVINKNMYSLQSYSQMLVRDVNFGKLGLSPVGIITGDSGITFPPYKNVKICGVIKI